jgi:hypothetical protein
MESRHGNATPEAAAVRQRAQAAGRVAQNELLATDKAFRAAVLYRPELMLTRQGSCIESAWRLADVVV